MKKIVRKENRCLRVEEEDVKRYLADGYDEIDEKGKIIGASSVKTYTAAEVAKMKAEYELQIKKLEAKLVKGKKSDETTSE